MNDSTSTPIRQKRKGATTKSTAQAAVIATETRVNSVTETLGTRSEARSPDLVISAVRHQLVEVEELLERAIKMSAGSGDHIGRLLQMGWDQLLPKFFRALQPDAFSAETVNSAIEVLRDLQGILVAIETAERGAERGPIAQQAFNTVANAILMLDQKDLWPAEPTPAAEWRFEQELNFARGRELALDLLRAEEASRAENVCCWRRHREGRPQFRFWKQFIEQLVARPELIDGFDAVMSASKEDATCITVAELARATVEEFAAGVVGADGTVPDDNVDCKSEALAVAAAGLTTETPAEAQASLGSAWKRDSDAHDKDSLRLLSYDCYQEIAELTKTVKEKAEAAGSRHTYNGLISRIQQLGEIIYLAMDLNGSGDVMTADQMFQLSAVYEGRLA